jgi:hypothetical protein
MRPEYLRDLRRKVYASDRKRPVVAGANDVNGTGRRVPPRWCR